ncbi:MAG TPA: hypothetical protein VKF42_11610 [Chitinivibrionales bacterium]|jgi:hypothetical protein|nr:hypothetical protein [Chitinivibrionales bacterium]
MECSASLKNNIPSRVILGGKLDRNPQVSRILFSAAKRATEAVVFFEERGALSDDVLTRAFYFYMSVKKDAQRAIIWKIAQSLGLQTAPVLTYPQEDDAREGSSFDDESLKDVFGIVHEVAADELEFYISYAAMEKDTKVNSILLMLADLAKEFLFDAKIWYLNHKESTAAMDSGLQDVFPADSRFDFSKAGG